MTTLPPTTKSRLQKIPLFNVVWEGDRRPLGSMAAHFEGVRNVDNQCIIWLDGSEGVVRAIDLISEDMGMEAIVRTLLRAIESPHHPNKPCRPQKIVVRDREIQFFLRGVLQDLEIEVEYVPQLPLIERLFEGFAVDESQQPNPLPDLYLEVIHRVARKIWDLAPWELLTDSDVLEVELKNCETERVYVCVMGMMSAEYGLLLYRSLDSLKQFRSTALGSQKSAAELERAFLAQDCWFLNYEERENKDPDLLEMDAFFGSLHPFEGMRHFLDEAETRIVYTVLESIERFYSRHRSLLEPETITSIYQSYRISLPTAQGDKETISTKVSTLPELSAELIDMGMGDRANSTESVEAIQEDLVPDGSLITLSSISQELIEQLQRSKTYCQRSPVAITSELATVFIQTTRPKANRLIERIKDAGGLKTVCFNPGHNSFSGEFYDLGMLQTEDDELYIFAEYDQGMLQQLKNLERWDYLCHHNQGYCGVVIAMGATGANRGKPQAKDMLALFQVRAINGADIGMGVLQLMSNLDL